MRPCIIAATMCRQVGTAHVALLSGMTCSNRLATCELLGIGAAAAFMPTIALVCTKCVSQVRKVQSVSNRLTRHWQGRLLVVVVPDPAWPASGRGMGRGFPLTGMVS